MSTTASTAALSQICQRLLLLSQRAPRHPASGQILEILLRDTTNCHFEGGLCPKNLLFLEILRTPRFQFPTNRPTTSQHRTEEEGLGLTKALFAAERRR